jgi:predicted amidohydrolase YtcJ
MRYLSLILLLFIVSCSAKKTPADLIIKGGKIYTMNVQQPSVEAVAVIADKIVYAGDSKGLEKFQDEKTKVIDLQGKTMTPGFIEGHGHFIGLGYNAMNLDLMRSRGKSATR